MQTQSTMNQKYSLVALRLLLIAMTCTVLGGCHDGPMYGLKTMNPYYTMWAWKKDEALGVTDHERLSQIRSLSGQIAEMPEKEQDFWADHLERIIDTDPSPEMRFHAVHAASGLKSSQKSLNLIEKGLGDESIKVQTACCQSLGVRKEPEAVQMLAQTLGSTTEIDVKHSAIAALKNHKGAMPTNALRVILEEQDPATVYLAMDSLRDVMDQDLGNDPKTWIAAIDAKQSPNIPGTESADVQIAEKDARSLK